jgi:ribonuclease HII
MKETKILIEWPEDILVAGLDEVGRGCLAGPVVTAAVILPRGFTSPLLRDSKKLKETERKAAYELILANALAYSVDAGSAIVINEIGINPSTFASMHRCLDKLTTTPQHILVDGNQWKQYKSIKHTCVVKGDDTYACIAAASIVAKVRRDEYMDKLHEIHPNYGWNSNKGYGTPAHISGLKEFGSTRYHRTQFIKNFLVK